MYKNLKYILPLFVCVIAMLPAKSQVTTESPYSAYGLGNLRTSVFPGLRGMGGISTGVFKPDGYSMINVMNPATYSGINLTTLDIGVNAGFTGLQRGNESESRFNATLNHIALGIPVSRKSAFSFGLLPYSDLGYNYSNRTRIDTMSVDHIYAGEGSISKAFLGYGVQFGKYVRIGANLEYLFGNLSQTRSTVFPNELAVLPTRMQNKTSVEGLNFSYGIQTEIPLSDESRMTLGYSGSYNSNISAKKSYVLTQYTIDQDGVENSPLDTLQLVDNAKSDLKLPLEHNFGLSIQRDNKWMIGADFRMGQWSKFSLDNSNQGLQDSYGVSVGGQITPDITAVGGSLAGYLKRIDYRVGVRYDKTYLKLANNDIKDQAVSIGFGFPLPSNNRSSFYKINFTTELGRRGTTAANLVQETYLNIHLGFTLNDTWFRRFRFD
ncbi:hypothetical protein [Pedobacter sp. SYP-B3415]|uniref:hypothetical protein n=1 Tax=Pedobacter sp. SYP-B3415 TaxID=2496641 RepID=UPI00101CB850|nr:hypothetical protein [Pedobacter sp. SYP-B3415]